MLMIKSNTKVADWHKVSAVEATRRLDVDPETGLSSKDAEARLDEFGPNRLREILDFLLSLKLIFQTEFVFHLVIDSSRDANASCFR